MTDLPPQIQRWCELADKEKELRAIGSTVDGIAQLSGLPRWLIFKTVAGELAEIAQKAHERGGEANTALGLVVSEAIDYASQFTREDGYGPVWRERRKETLKAFIADYTEK